MNSKDYQKILASIVLKPIEEQPILLGALLTELFHTRKVRLVIVGGAAVQFYTQAGYTTSDLDAILTNDNTEDIESVMKLLEFKRTTTYRHFEHPLFKFIVEFPPSPVEVGNRHISEMAIITTELGPVKIINIEDLIMDRIIAGVEWKSESSLMQARLMWSMHKKRLNKKYLTEFATKEGYLDTLEAIKKPAPKPRKRGK